MLNKESRRQVRQESASFAQMHVEEARRMPYEGLGILVGGASGEVNGACGSLMQISAAEIQKC